MQKVLKEKWESGEGSFNASGKAVGLHRGNSISIQMEKKKEKGKAAGKEEGVLVLRKRKKINTGKPTIMKQCKEGRRAFEEGGLGRLRGGRGRY